MEAYTDFASVYDTFMDNTPYEEWAEYIIGLLKAYGVSANGSESVMEENPLKEDEMQVRREALDTERNVVVDLGCGTGTLTELLADAGYDMIGIDNSQEMLNIALAKREKSGKEILYLLQDMREFELYGTAGAIISVCDSLNYLLEEEDILATFRLVNNYLYPGGIFIFDFNTVYKYETVIGDTTIAENREDCSFIWENYYDAEGQINEYDLTIFARVPEMSDGVGSDCSNGVMSGSYGSDYDGGVFRRFTETHFQRGYTLEQMKGLVEKAGMKFVTAIDADTHSAVHDESERIYVVAREFGKDRAKKA